MGNKKKKWVASNESIRNENILCAIISLMRELDRSGIEFVKKDCEKRLTKFEWKYIFEILLWVILVLK